MVQYREMEDTEKQRELDECDLSTQAGRLRYARLKMGYRQEDLAEMIGKHPVTYGHYERGRSRISNKTASDLSDILCVHLEWLISGKGPMDGIDPVFNQIENAYQQFSERERSDLAEFASDLLKISAKRKGITGQTDKND